MRILITGGAGFLGLHLALYLAKKQCTVILLDVGGFDKREYPKNCRFVKADIRNKKRVNRLTHNIDVVIHAAAALPLWKEEEIFDINICGTRSVLNAAYENKVKRFVFISSTAVYGVPKKHPVYETDPLIGVGAYGQSKIDAEAICGEYRTKGMIVSVVRPKTFVGTHRLGVFEILFDWIKDGKKIPLIGDGNNHYQLLDVDDLVEAVYRLITLKDEKKANDTFNIGAKKFGTVKQDLGSLFDYAYHTSDARSYNRLYGRKSKIVSTPAFIVKKALWVFEKLKLSPLYQWVYDTADRDSYVSIKRLEKTLHWSPRYSNAQALIKSYRWYEDHYREIKSRPAGITHTVGWKQGILGFFKRFL